MTTMKKLEEAVRQVLLAAPVKHADYENRKPTKEELKTRFRLVRKR